LIIGLREPVLKDFSVFDDHDEVTIRIAPHINIFCRIAIDQQHINHLLEGRPVWSVTQRAAGSSLANGRGLAEISTVDA
jgi:hypothetical protein